MLIFSKIDVLSKTMILGASLSMLVATLGLLGYLPGLSTLGRILGEYSLEAHIAKRRI